MREQRKERIGQRKERRERPHLRPRRRVPLDEPFAVVARRGVLPVQRVVALGEGGEEPLLVARALRVLEDSFMCMYIYIYIYIYI